MGRHVFFSFDIDRDGARAAQLRDRWVGRDRTAGGFIDPVSWVSVSRRGREGIEAWIDGEMRGASVVVVLVGAHTADRWYVRHALERGHAEGMGLLAIRVHLMPDPGQVLGVGGSDPFGRIRPERPPRGDDGTLRGLYTTHDWLPGFSDRFLPDWIELSAERAGR